jgi:hypothetical protein
MYNVMRNVKVGRPSFTLIIHRVKFTENLSRLILITVDYD